MKPVMKQTVVISCYEVSFSGDICCISFPGEFSMYVYIILKELIPNMRSTFD